MSKKKEFNTKEEKSETIILNESSEIDTEKKWNEQFSRIREKFREYWIILAQIIIAYIVFYLLWLWGAPSLQKQEKRYWGLSGNDKGGNSFSITLIVAVIRGLFFVLDGKVTSLLKSPFSQLCYAINQAKIIDNEIKDNLITKLTESIEFSKDTLKRFGMLGITVDLLKVLVQLVNLAVKKQFDFGMYYWLLDISYLVPIFWAAHAIYSVHATLEKVKKEHYKKTA